MSFYALAAESVQAANDVGSSSYGSPWVVGGTALGIFIIAMLILLAFGNGRDHT